MHRLNTKRIDDPLKRAGDTLANVQRILERFLNKEHPRRFDVTLRLYAGWHSGLTPTIERRAVEEFIAGSTWNVSRSTNVHFAKTIYFGDYLLAADARHLVTRRNIHLPDTLRANLDDPTQHREKMVDTALVADLIAHSRSNQDEWRLVLSDDDDIIPGLLVASYWTRSSRAASTTKVLRWACPSKHLSLYGLAESLGPGRK